MPPNTVKVDRSTRFGNPFIIGANGSALQCVYQFEMLMCGYLSLGEGMACLSRQERTKKLLIAEKAAGWPSLRAKNLACWCAPGKPCHADVLLNLANGRIKAARAMFAEHVSAMQEMQR